MFCVYDRTLGYKLNDNEFVGGLQIQQPRASQGLHTPSQVHYASTLFPQPQRRLVRPRRHEVAVRMDSEPDDVLVVCAQRVHELG